MEDYFGDPMLFKVNKKKEEGHESGMTYVIEDILSDPALMNVWVNPLHSAYSCDVSVCWIFVCLFGNYLRVGMIR
jgi:hypothetical protein